MNDIKKHTRVNDILLGPLERPALKWLASHMPLWVTPDGCTVIGVFGALLIAVSYGLTMLNPNFLWLASLGFVINWFGDSLDGTLARYRRIERPIFGFYIDHVVDIFNEALIFLGLGLTPYINFTITCLTLIAYLTLSGITFIRTCVVGEFKISFSKLGPTEIRVLAILLNTGMYFGGRQAFPLNLGTLGKLTFSIYDAIVGFITLLLLWFAVSTAIKDGANLINADRKNN